MTGNKTFVVLEIDGDGDVISVWGPFDLEENADEWPGVPGSYPDTTYRTVSMHEPPEWQTEWYAEDSEKDGE